MEFVPAASAALPVDAFSAVTLTRPLCVLLRPSYVSWVPCVCLDAAERCCSWTCRARAQAPAQRACSTFRTASTITMRTKPNRNPARTGACSAFVQYFQDHQDQYNAPDDQFRTLADAAPYPSGACCAAARRFVGQKCSCDGPTLGNAQQARPRRRAIWPSPGC